MVKKYMDIRDYVDVLPLDYKFIEMVIVLLEAKRRGDLVSSNFNGHMFYSDKIELDKAYLEYYDMTYSEHLIYERDADKITFELIGHMYTDFFISTEKYKDFVKELIAYKSNPQILQIFDYVIKNTGDIIFKVKKEYYINRFNKFNDYRKNFAKEIIDKYIDEKYKDQVIEGLGLKKKQNSLK